MILLVNRYKLSIALILFLFYGILSFLHFNYIIYFEDFNFVSYYAKIDFSFVLNRFLISVAFLLLNISAITFIKSTDFLFSILVLVLLFFVIPSGLVFSSSADVYPKIFILNNIFFYTIILFSSIRLNLDFPILKTRQAMVVLFLLSLIGIVPFIIEYWPYINFKNLLLIDIYQTRTLVFDNVSNLFTAYTYSWFSKIIIPVLIVFSIYFKDYLKLIVTVLILLFLFLCGAHKMVFAGAILLLAFYKYDYLVKTKLFIRFLTTLLVISILSSFLFDYNYIWDITFRRGLMLTALLDYCYFDFFNNRPIYWSDSFLSGYMNYPYDLPSTYMIGKTYLNKPYVNANVGIISDGFKNFGLIGSILNIIIVSLYITLLNRFNISAKFFGVFVLLIFSFLNSALSTIMVTHGGLLLLVISMFLLRNSKNRMDYFK